MPLHKIRHLEIATTLYDFVGKTPRDVELENGIVWKLVVSRHRLQVDFFDTLDESESFHRTLRVTAESVGALARPLGVRHLRSTEIELGRL